MDEKQNNDQTENVEEPPRFGDDAPNPVNSRQQASQALPPRDPEEQYILDEPYKRDEEMSQELAANDFRKPMNTAEQETSMKSEAKTGFGWVAVILAALSFFMMPVVLGAAAIIFGFISRNRGADTLGNTAIIAGAISIVLALFVAPFV
ncbi:DUF4190 domain-containing protein [Sediminibacillus massiliensis]|uniref:DUF4190 domain-containing protein n=1 Tax=Sediminibacillus massiliensis TaxID=1926277 RepID=UPI0009887C05|nr:DUF4190 domain-containing protein [Sediminibacillus massiliensis]